MKKTDYFKVGDIVNMHCGEQGIVLEILDDDHVYLLQCNGHVEKYYAYDIWHSNNEQNGKKALHELFMKTFGYSGMYEEEIADEEKELSIEQLINAIIDDNNEIPF